MIQHIKAAILSTFLLNPLLACSQQQVDNEYVPVINKPLYEPGKGPVMLVDGGHHNFHTLEDKFAPFGKIAEKDGFNVRNVPGEITGSLLKDARILVIANALNKKNVESWQQPVYPAFTQLFLTQICQFKEYYSIA